VSLPLARAALSGFDEDEGGAEDEGSAEDEGGAEEYVFACAG
jgi:hypothetical protein